MKGPSVASTGRPRRGPFSVLLDRIEEDEDALDAFIYAYQELTRPERAAFAHAVVQDAGRPATALLALLEVEPDHALRRRLADLVRGHADVTAWTRLDGSPTDGEAELSHGVDGLVATLRVRWNDGEITHLAIEPSHASRFDGTASAQREAIDLITPMLWRYIRRGGALPDGMRRFAGFFSHGGDGDDQW